MIAAFPGKIQDLLTLLRPKERVIRLKISGGILPLSVCKLRMGCARSNDRCPHLKSAKIYLAVKSVMSPLLPNFF